MQSATQAEGGVQNFEDTIPAIKEFIKQYNKIAELCFNDCINDFTTRKVLNSEDVCVTNCLEKFLKMNQRISMRFQEHQMLVNENQMVAAQRMGIFK